MKGLALFVANENCHTVLPPPWQAIVSFERCHSMFAARESLIRAMHATPNKKHEAARFPADRPGSEISRRLST
jgi:hypothetical protein